MATIPNNRQIKPEDFDSKDQKLIQKLAFPINTFMQQVITALSNNLDFNNLNEQIVSFTVSVDSSGTPTTPVQFKNSLKTKPIGMVCISAVNTSTNLRFPVATPFASFTLNGDLIVITNIAGLNVPTGQTNSDSYTLTLRVTGANIPTA